MDNFEISFIVLLIAFLYSLYMVNRLKIHVARIEQDAKRYRHLRSLHWSDDVYSVVRSKELSIGTTTFRLGLLDDALDECIRKVSYPNPPGTVAPPISDILVRDKL